MYRRTLCLLAISTLACAPDQPDTEHSMLPSGAVVSLLGDTLLRVPVTENIQRTRQTQLDAARAAYESTPTNADSIIWYGRRLGYMGDYQEAIAVYTKGIEIHPNDARLYRHRGHRYITVRNLPAAQEDFEQAVSLVDGQPDEIEPDGQPNAMNIPTSTLQSNIWYHLGLARYLQGDFAGAAEAYRRGADVAKNDDMLVANSYWRYMTLARLGRTDEAGEILRPITRDMNILENGSYQRLLLLFKGTLPPDSVLDVSSDDNVALANATVTYGVGAWHLLNGRDEQARAMWEDTLRGTQWAAFGYIAAEAELARDRAPTS